MAKPRTSRVVAIAAAWLLAGCSEHAAPPLPADPAWSDGAWRVQPGQSIQQALDLAAADPVRKRVVVFAGTYRPSERGQAFLRLIARHDGITLEADGDVTLSAANPELADREAASYPAVVNHVIYCGDGLSARTVVRGFRITGANRFATDLPTRDAIEPRYEELRRTEGDFGPLFFFTDGGGIKVFGRSCPTLERLIVHDNHASPCGGGVSIEQRGTRPGAVVLRDCVFRDNRAQVTGSAVDLLPGSVAELIDCLFVGNLSNRGDEHVPIPGNLAWPEIPGLIRTCAGYLPESGSGALTVFASSTVHAVRCTFTGNANGVDDRGQASTYRDCIFWRNDAGGGVRRGEPYDLDLARANGVEGCFIGGRVRVLRGALDARQNRLDCGDPRFDARFAPTDPAFAHVGYRPPPAPDRDAQDAR